MTNLFKKAAVFTDIHFGLKSNSTLHNEDCLNFVKWATAKAKEEGCETCIFTGDWHNNRASINILTLGYSLRALEHLNENFENTYQNNSFGNTAQRIISYAGGKPVSKKAGSKT